MDDPITLEMSVLLQLLLGWLELLDELEFDSLGGQTVAHTVRVKLLSCKGMIESAIEDNAHTPGF